MDLKHLDNAQIADRLREYANLLEDQDADRFRVGAYRRAAGTITSLRDDLGRILDRDGISGLISIPDVGESIARAIAEMVSTGRWMQLERLRGESQPHVLFMSVPGIGPETAKRLEETLNVDTLEALEIAAHDGRLESVPGIGPRKAAAIRAGPEPTRASSGSSSAVEIATRSCTASNTAGSVPRRTWPTISSRVGCWSPASSSDPTSSRSSTTTPMRRRPG